MGFSISWIAVKDRKLNQVIEYLGIDSTNEVEEFPESDISGADLPNGWCHIQFSDFDSPFIQEAALQKISDSTQVIFCQIEEHVMYSKSCCWENGRFSWSSEHDAQQDLRHIISNGEIPDDFEKIKKDHLDMQDQEDSDVDCIFEVPLALASLITSIKHDELPEEEIEYQVLKTSTDCEFKSKPWWKRIWKSA